MRKVWRILVGVGIAVISIGNLSWGQTVEQQVQTSGESGFLELTFAPFDSMNGVRALSSVAFEYDGFLDMDVLIKNYTALELEPGDWYVDAGANMILAFDSKPGFDDGGPFYGLGGVFETDITGVLSAGSGGTPFSNPTAGDVTVTAMLSDEFLAFTESSEMLRYFEADSPLTAKLAPFQDFVLSPPVEDPFGLISAEATSIEFGGTLTVTYHWVPALGRPEDCNADGSVDARDLACACSGGVSVEHILNAVSLAQGDLNADGEVGFADFLTLSANFGQPGDYLQGDLDCDGAVAFADFLLLSANFGQTTGEVTRSVPEPTLHHFWWLVGIGCAFRGCAFRCPSRRSRYRLG